MEPTDNEIREVVQSTWYAFLSAEVEPMGPGDPSPGSGTPGDGALLGRVAIDGAWQGEVLIGCDESLGRTAAATFFALPPEEVGQTEIHDTIAELANVLGGNLKCLLPPGCQLSLPRVDAQANGDLPMGGAVGFRCEGQPFWVALRRRSQPPLTG